MSQIRKPFHKSIVDAIRRATPERLLGLEELVMATKIPKNHDGILEALTARTAALGFTQYPGVLDSLREQKEEVEATAVAAAATTATPMPTGDVEVTQQIGLSK